MGDKVKVAWDGRGDRWVADVSISTAHKKVAINPNSGEILTGDGTAAPTEFAPVPSGAILMWSGSSDLIPDGWLLCDGTNGTPDLRNRFVVGF